MASENRTFWSIKTENVGQFGQFWHLRHILRIKIQNIFQLKIYFAFVQILQRLVKMNKIFLVTPKYVARFNKRSVMGWGQTGS